MGERSVGLLSEPDGLGVLTVGDERGGEAAHAMEKQPQGFGGWRGKGGWHGAQSVAEAFLLHLFCGRGKSLGASVFHGNETEGLRERHAIGAGLKELDLGTDLAVNSLQGDITESAVADRALGEDRGTPGER